VIRRTVVVLVLAALAAGCGDDDPTSGPVTGEAVVDHLVFVTGVSTDVRLRVNGVLRGEVGYGDGVLGDVVPLGPDTSLRFRAEDTSGAAINERDVTLVDGERYAAYLLGDRGSLGFRAPRLRVEPLEDPAPPPGKSRVRFLHALVDADNVDVFVGDGTAWLGVGFTELTGFLDFDPGVDTLYVRDAEGVVAATGGRPLFQEGRNHRVVLAHRGPDRKLPADLFLLTDELP
jgi:hypothetical protein